MLCIKRFINELMSSNCFIIYNDQTKRCVIIDPASENSEQENLFIKELDLLPSYIILTHEHTDHTWGVNALVEKFGLEVICHAECGKVINDESRVYFQFYFDNLDYNYKIKKIDKLIEDVYSVLGWDNFEIEFLYTPGHSKGSMCVKIENYLFSGDTIMQYKPFISKKNGSKDELKNSIDKIKALYNNHNIIVCPGHGESFLLHDYNLLIN